MLMPAWGPDDTEPRWVPLLPLPDKTAAPRRFPAGVPRRPAIVVTRGSHEHEEVVRQGNQKMLESARRLEEEDEELCDTEEAKLAFRVFKVKFAAIYGRLASRKPEDFFF
ncbi:hypothetical protein ACP4OV_007435 [Aristida adscensionis]